MDNTMTKKLDLTKPVQTREGRPARILCTDRKRSQYPVVALVEDPAGEECVDTFTLDGRFRTQPGVDAHRDLVNVPPKPRHVDFRRVFHNGGFGPAQASAEDCKNWAGSVRLIGVIKVTTYDDDTFTVEKVEV